MAKILLKHGHLVIDGNKEYLDGALLINGESIEEVFVSSDNIKKDLGEYKEFDLKGKIVMPGFFDTHCHGCAGVDFNNANKKDIEKASLMFAKKGTTSFFTTLTNNSNFNNELEVIGDYDGEYARNLGIHLEGPFISDKNSGVIKKEYIYSGEKDLLNKILEKTKKIKQMTIAPEIDGSKQIIKALKDNDIKVMFGHSGAKNDDLNDKDNDGYTHLFNAMSGFHHRDIGLVNKAFTDEKYVEIIGDGFHIDKSVLQVILKNIRRDRIILVSDAIKVAGLEDGEFEFEGSVCVKKDLTSVRKSDGRIAGNAGFISNEIKIMYDLGAKLTDILLMTSLNAYRFYGLDKRFGSLLKGKYGDIVILDENLKVYKTYVRGKEVNA